MTQSPSPQSTRRPWFWPLDKLKYNQMQTHGNDLEEYELGGACHSLDKNDREPKVPLKSQLIHCLPQGFAKGIDKRVQQEKGQQREWVIGVLICTFCASIILLLNISLTIAAAVYSYSKFKGQGFTSAMLYHGNCDISKNWARGLHMLINILSTILLAASNYCMQCLSSPSRQNVESAHTQRNWLHIGVPNIKNLRFVGWKRCVLWMVLLISSLPVHFVYNSAVFSALGTHEYGVFLASADFDFNNPPKGGPDYTGCSEEDFSMHTTEFYSQVSTFEKLDTQNCRNTYAADYLADRGTLILITNNLTVDNGSLHWVAMGNSPQKYSSNSFSWMCDSAPSYPADNKSCSDQCKMECLGDWTVSSIPWSVPLLNVTIPSRIPYNISFNVNRDDIASDRSTLGDREDLSGLIDFLRGYPQANELQRYLDDATRWNDSSWAKNTEIHDMGFACALETVNPALPATSVDYCLSQKVDEKCQLLFSLPICITVVLCNAVKIVCMLVTAHDDRKEIFLTIGDAIASFLRRPDRTTKGRCLLSRRNISGKGPYCWALADQYRLPPQPTTFWLQRRRWKSAADGSNLGLVVTLCLYIIVASLICLTIGLFSLLDISFPALWNLRFGSVASSTVLKMCDNPSNCSGIISMILLANTPQIIVSGAYFFYNNTLTAMLLAVEFNDYASERKPLRVSWPKGIQRSTYYLSLPYQYSIPLLVAHTALHWLVSQSVFFVEVILYDMAGKQTPERLISCGYSPMAIIFAIILGASMIIVILGLGFKRFKNRTPLASSCSAAISAACHPPPGGGDTLKPIMWGEVLKPMVNDNPTDTGSQEDDGDHTVSRFDSRNYCTDENSASHQGQENGSKAHFLGRYKNNNAGDDIGEVISYIGSRLDTRDGGSFEEVTLVDSDRESDGETTLLIASRSGTRSDSNEESHKITPSEGNNAYLLGEENGSEYGHCSFSSAEVAVPSLGKQYH